MRDSRPAGPVERKEHDYALWEKRVDALLVLLSGKDNRLMTVDELRRNIEGRGSATYEALSYYERWIHAITQTLIQHERTPERAIEVAIERARLIFPDEPFDRAPVQHGRDPLRRNRDESIPKHGVARRQVDFVADADGHGLVAGSRANGSSTNQRVIGLALPGGSRNDVASIRQVRRLICQLVQRRSPNDGIELLVAPICELS
ncbi:MAG: hypothetical protein ACLQDQ_02595 [Myxococcaceae bacterium]